MAMALAYAVRLPAVTVSAVLRTMSGTLFGGRMNSSEIPRTGAEDSASSSGVSLGDVRTAPRTAGCACWCPRP